MSSTETDRIERLLALLLIQNLKGIGLGEKAHQLRIAGFTNLEIADLFGMSSQGVADILYKHKKQKSRR